MSRIENYTTVMIFILCLKLTSSGRSEDVIMQTSLWDAARTSLGRLYKFFEKFDKFNCFCFLMVPWNYILKMLL